jgi:hypothetical protein
VDGVAAGRTSIAISAGSSDVVSRLATVTGNVPPTRRRIPLLVPLRAGSWFSRTVRSRPFWSVHSFAFDRCGSHPRSGRSAAGAGFLAHFDFIGDGSTDTRDRLRFYQRFGTAPGP